MSEHPENFEVIARAVVVQNGKILLCRAKEKGHYFFPGGHVEKGERTEVALKREFLEELGAKIGKTAFIGAVENIFRDSYEHHEINLVFEAEVFQYEFKSREDHLEFELLSLDEFAGKKVLPVSLKKAVAEWLKDKKIFWRSESRES